MKRDFSNSTREQIIGIIKDREALYSNDISAIDLFVCKDTDSSDYQVYATDISDNVGAANSSLSGCNGDAETLVLKTNEVFGEAQRIDGQYATIVETDASCTVDGYIGDLKVLINAISVKGLGDSTTDILCNLGKYDSDGVFGDPGEFAADLNNDLYERLYNDLVVNGEVDQALLEEIMQDDSLTDRELAVLFNMVNNVYIVDGELDYDAIEKFLEASYIGTEYPFDDYTEYTLSGAYLQFAQFYNNSIMAFLMSCEGTLVNGYGGLTYDEILLITSMNGILTGTMQFYNPIYVEVMERPIDETGAMERYYELDIQLDRQDGEEFITINANGENTSEIKVYDLTSIRRAKNENERQEAYETIQNANDVYINTVNNGLGDIATSAMNDAIKEALSDAFENAVGEVSGMDTLGVVIDIWQAFDAGDQAYQEAQEANQQAMQIIAEANSEDIYEYGSGIDTPCLATVIAYEDQCVVANQHVDQQNLAIDLAYYNEYAEQNGLAEVSVDDVTEAVYNPTQENYDNIHDFIVYEGQAPEGGESHLDYVTNLGNYLDDGTNITDLSVEEIEEVCQEAIADWGNK